MKNVNVSLLLVAAMVLGGCWAGRDACRGAPPEPGAVPVQVRMEAQIKYGHRSGTAAGDAYIVPPDTFRLEFTSPWGEALFDVRAAGGRLFSVTAGEGIEAAAVEKAFVAAGSSAVRALFTGWECGRDSVLYTDSTVTVKVRILGRRERPGLTGENLLK